MNRVADLGCIACLFDGNPGTPPELHHPRSGTGGGLKAPDGDVVPLCAAHHRGTMHPEIPSIHLAKNDFILKYGTERKLLETVVGMLENKA